MSPSTSAPPPSPQEIQRKLSVHSGAKSPRQHHSSAAPVSGTESDSDSIPDTFPSSTLTASALSSGVHASTSAPKPLSSIAERRTASGEDSEEDEDDQEGGWKTADAQSTPRDSVDESVIKAGYLWKKGERRKTWKKRWFVLRPAHLAYYKTAAEYQLLRLLELSDVHSCTRVALKKHENTFGLVSAVRTFYLQAKTSDEVQDWVKAIEEARQILATSTQQSASVPIPIPRTGGRSNHPPPITPSPPSLSHPSHSQNITSSDSEDASPSGRRTYSMSSQNPPTFSASPSKAQTAVSAAKDPAKTILSGYLMKCGSKRHNWRKRWFVLSGERLLYSGSHMDTKPHGRFLVSEILDALEYDLAAHRQNPTITSPPVPSPTFSSGGGDDESHRTNLFKIVTTKRTLLLCAPSEEDEIKWLGAVRALIARRSESGMVPGDPEKTAASNDVSPTSGISSGASGLMNKVRRLSASGSGLPMPSSVITEEGSAHDHSK